MFIPSFNTFQLCLNTIYSSQRPLLGSGGALIKKFSKGALIRKGHSFERRRSFKQIRYDTFRFLLLCFTVYRNEEGKPYVPPIVSSIEKSMAANETLNHEYLPVEGLRDMFEAATRLVLGDKSIALAENRVCKYVCLVFFLCECNFIVESFNRA